MLLLANSQLKAALSNTLIFFSPKCQPSLVNPLVIMVFFRITEQQQHCKCHREAVLPVLPAGPVAAVVAGDSEDVPMARP